jgi:hypothetical protein
MQISRTVAVGSASNAGAPSSRRSGSNALSRHPSLATLMLAHRRRPLGAYADRRSYGRSKRYMRSKTPFTRISSAVSYPIGSATGIGLDCALSLARRAYPAPLRRLLSPLERSEASERYGDEGIAPMGTRHAIAFVGTARPRWRRVSRPVRCKLSPAPVGADGHSACGGGADRCRPRPPTRTGIE